MKLVYILSFFIGVNALAQEPAGYYNAANGLEGEAKQSALHNIIDNHTVRSYGYLWGAFNSTDKKSNNKVWDMYSDVPGGTPDYEFTFGSDQCGNYSSEGDCYNREHIFPQGFFNSNLPMRSDVHHLFPTDVTSNSRRGNDPFGVVTGSTTWQMGGSKTNNSTFEPRDVHKGACARAMMYFVIRYQDYSNHFAGQEGILRQWHNQFPASTFEENRNSDIENLQNNRNPFVDYPQFEERINAFVTNSVAPNNEEIYFSDDTIKLLSDAGRYYYEYILYNSGNVDIEFDNFTLSDTSLHFHSSLPSDFELAPSESMSVKISYNSAINYNANLQFYSDLNAGAQITIPIVSTAMVGLSENRSTKINLYPNPTSGLVNIESSINIKKVRLIGLEGEEIELKQKTSRKMDFSHLTPGLYFVKIIFEDGSFETKRLLIQ